LATYTKQHQKYSCPYSYSSSNNISICHYRFQIAHVINDVHLHMLTVAQLFKKFNAFYETQKFITLSIIDHNGPPTVKQNNSSIKTGSAM
jgi:hypothetical protein